MRNFINSTISAKQLISISCFLILFNISLIAAAQVDAKNERWPMHMKNEANNGYTNNEPPPNLDIAWKFDTGNMRLYAPPVVYDGVVYVLGPSFYAIDAFTGKRIWSYPIQAAQDFVPSDQTKWHYWSEWSTPSVVGDRVYIVSSLDNEVIALDRTPEDGIDDGQADPSGAAYDVIWNYTIENENLFGSRSSPVVIHGILKVLYVGTAEGDLIAIDISSDANPKLSWKVNIGTRIDSSPAYYGDKIFIGTWDIRNRPQEYEFNESDTYFYAFDSSPNDDVDDGLPDPKDAEYDVVWRAKLGDLIWSSPTVNLDHKMVYIGCSDNRLYAFDLNTGEERWNYTTKGPIYATPAFTYRDERIVFGTTDGDNSLYCLNSTSGELIWKFEAGEKVAASPIIAGNIVYQAVMNKRIYVLDLNGSGDGTTSVISVAELPNRIRATPALANGHLYVSCWDGNLYCLGNQSSEAGPETDRIELYVTEFAVNGDSIEATISFAIVNLGKAEILNSTVFIYDGLTLLLEENLGPFRAGTKQYVYHTLEKPEASNHLIKIQLDYLDESNNEKKFFHNKSVTIDKHTIPSFIPGVGFEGAIIVLIFVAAVWRITIIGRK
jgi:outer membrane protein assembly factor BamB